MGFHIPQVNCCRTAPTATSEVSVIIQVGASGAGWFSSVALTRRSLAWDQQLKTTERRLK